MTDFKERTKLMEESILGSIILQPKLISTVRQKIQCDHFNDESNKVIFESMIQLDNQSMPIDMITINNMLAKHKHLDNTIEVSYITSLSATVATTSNINYYIDILHENYIRRRSIAFIENIKNSLYDENILKIESMINELKDEIINSINMEKSYIDASTIKKDCKELEFISTGFRELDKMLKGGFKSTSLTILTGEPGSGKSTILNQILAGIISDNYKTFLYSGELSNSDLMKWINITIANQEDIYIDREDVSDISLKKVSKWIKSKLILYNDEAIANQHNILSTIRHLASTKNIKVFILDNLMTFDLEDDKNNLYQSQKKLCIELKSIAKKYEIAIILVAHPKKPSGNDKPTMYDVAGASEIVGLADTVIRTVRPKCDNDDSKILLLKNRWGGIIDRLVRVKYDETRKRFYTNLSELERDYGYNHIT